MSEELSQVYTPTIHNLYYLLGSLRLRWRTIGEGLQISESDLDNIEKNFDTTFRRMIKMFDCWLCKEDQWLAIISVLENIDEEELALKISHYTAEMERIEKAKRDFCRKVVPKKTSSYEDKVLSNLSYKVDALARQSVQKCDIDKLVNCLKEVSSEWYRIGIAMGVPKRKLDKIKTRNHSDYQIELRKMLEALIEHFSFKCTWRKLIDELNDFEFNLYARSIQRMTGIEDNHISLIDEYRRTDFSSKSRNKIQDDGRYNKAVKEIRDVLKLDSRQCSDEQILNNLYQHIADKNPTLADRKKIVDAVTEISKLSDELSRELAQKADDLKADMKTAEETINSLKAQRRVLNQNKRKLEKEKSKILEAIESTSPLDKAGKEYLSKQLLEVDSKLTEVNKSLDECVRQLDKANAGYDSIVNELEKCKDHLHDVRQHMVHCKTYTESDSKRQRSGWSYAARGAALGAAVGGGPWAAVGGAVGAVAGGGVATVPLAVIGAATFGWVIGSIGALTGAVTGAVLDIVTHQAPSPEQQALVRDLDDTFNGTTHAVEEADKRIEELQCKLESACHPHL